MPDFKNDHDFNERRKASDAARAAALAKFKSKPSLDDPDYAARVAEAAARRTAKEERRQLAKLAREERIAEEKRAKEEAGRAAKEAAERAAFESQAAADLARAMLEAQERALLAKQKAARDARYAARKARK